MKKILFLLFISGTAWAALPDLITDPKVRDVAEYLDAKSASIQSANTFQQPQTFNGGINIGAATKSANGYTYLPNGLILVWGEYTGNLAHGSSYSPSFAKTFPTAVFQVVAYVANTVATTTTVTYCPLTALTTSGFTFQFGSLTGGTYNTTVRYFAIGH